MNASSRRSNASCSLFTTSSSAERHPRRPAPRAGATGPHGVCGWPTGGSGCARSARRRQTGRQAERLCAEPAKCRAKFPRYRSFRLVRRAGFFQAEIKDLSHRFLGVLREQRVGRFHGVASLSFAFTHKVCVRADLLRKFLKKQTALGYLQVKQQFVFFVEQA